VEAEKKGVPCFLGSVSDDDLLIKAGIKRAKGLFASADSDTENVYITLSAKYLNPDIFIVARASKKEMEEKLKKAGADRVISPYFMAGSRMASLATTPVSVEFLDIVTGNENMELWLKEIKIKTGSKMANKTLGELKIRQHSGAMILSVKKSNGGFEFSPHANSRIDADDTIVALGTNEQIKALEGMV